MAIGLGFAFSFCGSWRLGTFSLLFGSICLVSFWTFYFGISMDFIFFSFIFSFLSTQGTSLVMDTFPLLFFRLSHPIGGTISPFGGKEPHYPLLLYLRLLLFSNLVKFSHTHTPVPPLSSSFFKRRFLFEFSSAEDDSYIHKKAKKWRFCCHRQHQLRSSSDRDTQLSNLQQLYLEVEDESGWQVEAKRADIQRS